MARAKDIENLDCDDDVLTGARKVLHTRLDEVCKQRDAALDWSDVKGVHDMRVATRRLRSALRDFKPYLKHIVHRHELKSFNAQIKTLARALGAVRDLDVQIESLEKLKTQPVAAAPTRQGIEDLIGERESTRDVKRRALVETIEKINFVELNEKFIDLLTNAENENKKANNYRASAENIISDAYQQVEKLSDALFHLRAKNRPHHLRLAAKRLRYALDLFAPCFQNDTKRFVKKIAELQTSLGTFHDCDVWLDELAARLKRKEFRDANQSTRETLIHLLLHFADERTRAFSDSVLIWNEWESQKLGAQLLAQCRPPELVEIDIADERENANDVLIPKDNTTSHDTNTTETT